jgi:hypothetical protein
MRKLVVVVPLIAILASGGASFAASISKQYAWAYLGRTWTLTQEFAVDAYHQFRSLPRVVNYTAYADYILDPNDDKALGSLIGELEELAVSAGLNVWEKLNLIVAFVQSFRYVSEEGEYPRYPIETLVEGCGDCEDLAILAAAILRQMGFGVVLLAFTSEGHMAVGIRVLPPGSGDGQTYEWDGDTYYYLETTGAGWTIGRMPTRYTSTPDIIAVSSRTP